MTKKGITAENEYQYHTNPDQLRNNLSEKSKKLFDISIEKGFSNLVAGLSIYDFGFELPKQHFLDVICLRYGWNITNLPRTCPCGNRCSI